MLEKKIINPIDNYAVFILGEKCKVLRGGSIYNKGIRKSYSRHTGSDEYKRLGFRLCLKRK